jgi:hypothetical protein
VDWATNVEWERAVRQKGDVIVYRVTEAPSEILRRIIGRAIRRLATEGDTELRGPELDRLLATLSEGGTATIRGVICRADAPEWRFSRAPARR